jgi:hypothetical protein
VTAQQRLALVVMDDRDICGDEGGLPPDSLVPELTASILHVQGQRIRNAEKQLARLYECPEIAAMVARLEARRVYP